MSRTTKTLLFILGPLVIVAIALVMGAVTGKWVGAIGLIFGVVPICVYGLFMYVGSLKVVERNDELGG